MKKFSSWILGNQAGKQQKQTHSGRPKKNVHWKSAERPSPPGRPILIPLSDQQPDVVTLKWERPKMDGGSPIIGYFIEHRRMGSPHWVRSTPAIVPGCEVSISGLEPGWRYQFRAIAENIVGKSDPSELSDPLTVTLQRNAISVPRFANELTDKSVVENERVEFRVTILGQPPPEISWFKDGYEIFSSRRTKIVNDNDVSVLIIHQAALTDEGEIKCTATNRAGHVVTKAKLMVQAPPKIRLPRNYEDGLIVEADEVLRLKVGIAGQPTPVVTWLHENEPIKNTGRFELMTGDKNSSLKIENVTRMDRGEYSIRATNVLGEDSASFLVTVTSRPNPPGKVRLNLTFGKSATLSWMPPDDDGGCKIGNYIVEYFRVGWNVWLKAATVRQLSTTLNDLIEGSEYKFRVKAENPYGLSDPSEESDIVFIPDPKRTLARTDEPSKTVPPRRRTLSPQRIGQGNESSPSLQRKSNPQILDNEDLHREMSYGTNLEFAEIRKALPTSNQTSTSGSVNWSPSPRSPRSPPFDNRKVTANLSSAVPKLASTLIGLTAQSEKPFSPDILPIQPPSEPDSPSVIAPALAPTLTSVMAPVLRFGPATAARKDELSFRPPTPKPPSPGVSNKKSLLKQSNIPQIHDPPPSPEQLRNRSLSPPEPPLRRSPRRSPDRKLLPSGLRRSEEPAELGVNQYVQSYEQQESSSEKNVDHMQPSSSPNPTIHISAPPGESLLMSDTEKRDEVHTSNEFMLVLFHKNSKVKDKEKQDSFDLDLEEALQPPPISISTPDLVSMDFGLYTFPIRRSVSSTELLYERAMARFYEAVELEEAEKSRKIKVSQDKLSVKPTTMKKRLGSMTEAERLSFEKRSQMRRQSSDIGEFYGASNTKWDSKENVKLANRRKLQMWQDSQETDDPTDNQPKRQDSFEVESDYTSSTDSLSEDSIEKFKRELAARTRSPSAELETYHPRNMSAGTFTPYRAPMPEQSVIVLNRPVPLPNPDFIPKPILKRSSNENMMQDNTTSSPPPVSPNGEKGDKSKGLKSFFKWDRKSPTEKNTEANAQLSAINPISKPTQSDLELKRKAKDEEERLKVEAEKVFREEALVVVDHYSDIVRQVGGSKKYTTPLYLNPDEVRRTTAKANQEHPDDNIDEFPLPSMAYERHKPRLSLAERHQIQHVKETASRLAVKTVETPKLPETPSEDETGLSTTSQQSESRGRTKIVKVKRVVKRRVPSSSRTRDSSTSRPLSQIRAPSEDIRQRQILLQSVKNDLSSLSLQPDTSFPLVTPKTPEELNQETEEKVRSAINYITDVCLFIAACYVYLFKDARLVLPFLGLLVYRQIKEVIRSSIPDWMKKRQQ